MLSTDAGVAGPCLDPPVDGGATDGEDWGAWGGVGIKVADSCGFAGLAVTNQVDTKVGLPGRVPMGPAEGVWLGSVGTKLEVDPVVRGGVGPLGSRHVAIPAQPGGYCSRGTIQGSRRQSCLGQMLHSWPVGGYSVHLKALLPWQVTRPMAMATKLHACPR